MKRIAPDYYGEFVCIADRCRHSCCIGWEIDIDAETLKKYRAAGGEFGARLERGICEDADGAHFILDAKERCPFLNACGLCDIYIEMGESALSQICTDHPRFRSFFSDREEIGLGLCCEAAAELVLNRESGMQLVEIEKDGGRERLTRTEKQILSLRESLFRAAQDESLSLEERFQKVLSISGGVVPKKSLREWMRIYMELERLDEEWSQMLAEGERAEETGVLPEEKRDRMFANLLVYFLYRHVAQSETVEDAAVYAAFAVHATDIVRRLCAALHADTGRQIAEVVRFYSSEIEYSQENMDALLALF